MALKTLPLLFGGDYNPEQWPEATWEGDLIKLRQAHINSLTLNVFSWALLQPNEATYDFSLLDKIMALAAKYQMKVVLATATGAIPAWVIEKYPDVARTDIDGRHARQGMRHNACPSSPNFQSLAQDLVSRLAARYHDHPALVCWHISNEYGGQCYCDNCASAFRTWLRGHYPDLAAVNAAWNSNFWGHTFHDWSEILPPMHLTDMIDAGSDKPVLAGAALDYRRFQSDALLANFKLEKAAIRAVDATTPITTNLMSTQKDLDYFQWAKEMDIVSWDNYPSFDTPASETAMKHDLMAGLRQAPFMLMEQTPSQQNWQPYCALKKPGEMRMLSYQAVAHGANTVQFFQMKQSQNGIEKFHGAVISHAEATGTHETRVFREVQALGAELASLPADLLASRNRAKVAVLFDWPSFWGVEYATGPSRQMDYVKQVHLYYQMCYDAGLDVAMIGKETPFDGFAAVIAPVMYTTSEALSAKIASYVQGGGTFVTTYMSGIVDDHDNVYLGGYPGSLQEVLGLWNEEFDALPPETTVNVALGADQSCSASFLCDVTHPTTAKVLATYDDAQLFYTGAPAICQNDLGRGHALYVGTQLDAAGLRFLLTKIAAAAGLDLTAAEPFAGVEVTHRYSRQATYTFAINTTAKACAVANPAPTGLDLLSGATQPATLNLPAFGVVILKTPRA
ncbi:beta-galactosidase [Lacticaseibacillus parakribbianus]|uniref:beta-galactosidase n=1 Tax=Lacticaseibacillus parakribbianus TaxID=2970927 RepID=UPI0021CB61ED|nr:beta-galactosidase [Lacticaseibacillus parakribbianus]